MQRSRGDFDHIFCHNFCHGNHNFCDFTRLALSMTPAKVQSCLIAPSRARSVLIISNSLNKGLRCVSRRSMIPPKYTIGEIIYRYLERPPNRNRIGKGHSCLWGPRAVVRLHNLGSHSDGAAVGLPVDCKTILPYLNYVLP
jgi:hypothetical protein